MNTINSIHTHHRTRETEQAMQEAHRHAMSIPTARDLHRRDFPPKQWIVKDLLPPVGLAVIAGQEKVGKSWLLLQLGLAVSEGVKFIGNLQCKKTDVLYITLEDTDERIHRRLKRMSGSLSASRNLYIDTQNKINPDNIAHMLDAMAMIDVVIIDTLGRFNVSKTIDNNNYDDVIKMADHLQRLAIQKNVLIVLCTHTKKGAKPDEGTAGIMGSKALPATADVMLMMTREWDKNAKCFSDSADLFITGRDVEQRSIELWHTDDWVWFDKDTNFAKPHEEFNNFT